MAVEDEELRVAIVSRAQSVAPGTTRWTVASMMAAASSGVALATTGSNTRRDVVQVSDFATQLCRAIAPGSVACGVADFASRDLPGYRPSAALLVEELLGVMQADSESECWNRRRGWAASARC